MRSEYQSHTYPWPHGRSSKSHWPWPNVPRKWTNGTNEARGKWRPFIFKGKAAESLPKHIFFSRGYELWVMFGFCLGGEYVTANRWWFWWRSFSPSASSREKTLVMFEGLLSKLRRLLKNSRMNTAGKNIWVWLDCRIANGGAVGKQWYKMVSKKHIYIYIYLTCKGFLRFFVARKTSFPKKYAFLEVDT